MSQSQLSVMIRTSLFCFKVVVEQQYYYSEKPNIMDIKTHRKALIKTIQVHMFGFAYSIMYRLPGGEIKHVHVQFYIMKVRKFVSKTV